MAPERRFPHENIVACLVESVEGHLSELIQRNVDTWAIKRTARLVWLRACTKRPLCSQLSLCVCPKPVLAK
jgi:hypothetical protein